MRILLVDDQPSVIASVRSLIDDQGWDIHEAHSGEAGFECISQRDFDVIVSDEIMPGMSGVEFPHRGSSNSAQLRAHPPHRTCARGRRPSGGQRSSHPSAPDEALYWRCAPLLHPLGNRRAQDHTRRLTPAERSDLDLEGTRSHPGRLCRACPSSSNPSFGPRRAGSSPMRSCVGAIIPRSRTPAYSSMKPSRTATRSTSRPRSAELIGAALPQLPANASLFVNLHPHTLSDEAFLQRRQSALHSTRTDRARGYGARFARYRGGSPVEDLAAEGTRVPNRCR